MWGKCKHLGIMVARKTYIKEESKICKMLSSMQSFIQKRKYHKLLN
jgi:hypothetical protein